MTRHVVIVGGGLAGLAAASELAVAGHRVTVVEARARVGGATFSFRRDGLLVDNGQHVLLRCYTHYRAFLDRLGVGGHIELQDRFRVPVVTRDGRRGELFRTNLPAPLHLGAALRRYGLLSPVDRARVLVAVAVLRTLDPTDPRLDDRCFGDWLRAHAQTPATVEALWNLITVAALNTDADNAALSLCAMVFQTALLRRADAADIGIPRLPLGELHGAAATTFLEANGAKVISRAPVRAIRPVSGRYEVVLDGHTLSADAVVVAAPPDAAAKLLPPGAVVGPVRWTELGASPIVNVHVVYDRVVLDQPFIAVVGSPVQWAFDRSMPSGLASGQYVAVSVSAAGQWIDAPTERLRAIFLPELARLFPRARDAQVVSFFVTRERRATFRQAPGSGALRPAASTELPGCLLAGAWTATGWPDTMEGAVRSGNEAARMVGAHLARTQVGRAA